ncbi:MAG: cellulase family glycosylhydrolase [Bacteroidetes bacterium]|nr:cellulase family glycosylhydrolase [Bacteroidota bacterium]MBU1422756.1 cellulase family glycosylhydrolase [Bacteroidota bacterium]MBU2472224.1 cellulase family glycosylhydrolase [Bacteroidota bacterium]MBU2635530.1 cellulase family glycosylhydrolase [Bacteroidota bacterium]
MKKRTLRNIKSNLIACWALFLILLPMSADAQVHRIGIRFVNDAAEFYDCESDSKFIPRGNNYIRLAKQKRPDGGELYYHSTFNVGLYDTVRTAQALKKMKHYGYNVVRVFLNHFCDGGIGDKNSHLSHIYMNNVVDFLRRAKANSIYVMFTIDWLPIQSRVSAVENFWCPDFQCTNAQILTSEGLQSNQLFFMRFIKELIVRNAPIDIIFAYELRNELTFEPHLPPLSLSSGTITTANGKTYNLAKPSEKKKMLEEGLIYWIDQVRAKIREVDPSALVTVGLIPPQNTDVISTDLRKLSITTPVIWNSSADFVDLHVYPIADGTTIQEFVDRFGIAGVKNKPVVMGEFGTIKHYYLSIDAAVRDLQQWQAASCAYGFTGWILWSWDLDIQSDTYNALDGNESVNRVLAPVYRPDPCATASLDLQHPNIALDKPVKASRFTKNNKASHAVDGTSLPWVAGDNAPQWIEIDLQKPEPINKIRLMVAQTPAGETIHQIWVRESNKDYRMFKEIRGRTTDSQVLEFPTSGLTNIRFIKVVTVKSPSWVGWKEIEIIK